MLRTATANGFARHRARRRAMLKPGVVLRMALISSAVLYVLAPAVAQWVSLDAVRDEVAALRALDVPALAVVADPGPSPKVQSLLENAAPEDVRDLVAPGLVAVGELGDGLDRLRAGLVAGGIRAAQAFVFLLGTFVLSLRSTIRYRPRHPGGVESRILARKGRQ